jgi:glucose/arabinose dehydrogenase
MLFRAIAVTAAVAMLATGASALASDAGSAPPPPPTSTNGNPVHLVASGLKTPTAFAFGGGSIFEGDGGSEQSGPPNGGIYVLKGGTGTRIPGSPKFVAGLAWHKGALYSSGAFLTKAGIKWRISKWMGWNGKRFKSHKAVYVGPKGFDGFNGIGFAPNGRLYVGVDVGLTDGNDHGPRNTSPFVYDILSMQPNGKDVQVFASGMRQPWQMAFTAASNAPFVTDLGQDGPPKLNPPDFVLRVRGGQDYGFPKCNHTKPGKCAGFAKPYARFGPHTDLMGIGLHGRKLYLSSFLGRQGKGPGGMVFSRARSGGPLKPLLKGFVAPTVGLGIHGDYLFVGELTGQVFRVKI